MISSVHRLLPLLVGALLAGCGSRSGVAGADGGDADADADADADPNVDSDADLDTDVDADTDSGTDGFCDLLGAAIADALSDCCDLREDEIWAHDENVREECANEWQNDRVEIDLAAVDACVSLLTQRWRACAHLYVTPSMRATHACYLARRGIQAQHQPCTTDGECQTGLLCSRTEAGASCQPPLALGEEGCNGDRFRCGADAYCSDDSEEGVCRSRSAAASLCAAVVPDPCASGTYCDGSVCASRLEDSSPCDEDYECLSDLCNANGVCSSYGESICIVGEVLPD